MDGFYELLDYTVHIWSRFLVNYKVIINNSPYRGKQIAVPCCYPK